MHSLCTHEMLATQEGATPSREKQANGYRIFFFSVVVELSMALLGSLHKCA